MSRRMGSPKQLLRLGESTLLEHALANLGKANVDEIVLVLGFAAEEIQQKIPTDDLVIAINRDYQQGMGTSLRTGLAAVHPQAEGALIVLADQPLVRPATVNSMIEHHHRHRPQIVIPIYKGFRGNPILLDRSVFPELMNLQGDIGCRAIFGGHTENIHKLPVEDAGILLDLDTLADFSAMEALLEPQQGRSVLSANAEMEERPTPPTLNDGPQPELVIVGRDALAVALVRFASILGLTTTLVDPFLTLAQLPEAYRILHRLDFSMLRENDHRYVVVASRGQFDEEAMEEALGSGARYVALVANKGRREELMQTLRKKGFGEAMLQRLRSPAGLEIGAETPEEIALSILAQIVAEHRGVVTASKLSIR